MTTGRFVFKIEDDAKQILDHLYSNACQMYGKKYVSRARILNQLLRDAGDPIARKKKVAKEMAQQLAGLQAEINAMEIIKDVDDEKAKEW
jgi:hypothetical protein